MLDELPTDGWNPVLAFDDRKTVVRFWRDLGIVVAQVADGDF